MLYLDIKITVVTLICLTEIRTDEDGEKIAPEMIFDSL